MSTDSHQGSAAPSGWVLFGGAVLFIIAGFNLIQGFVALFKEEVYLVPGSDLVVTTDYTAWGVALLIWGGIMMLAALGLFAGKEWARWFAIIVVAINLIGQFAFFSAFPLWSLVVIGLDLAILWALTVRWQEAKAGLQA